jgi:hypothetical protein
MRAGLRAAIDAAEAALLRGDLATLVGLLPDGEQWRLWPLLGAEALFLDIETDGDERVTAVGMLDQRGPRLRLAERDLERFPDDTAHARLLVTFNGASFDVPKLRKSFRGWEPPPAHIDLCHLWRRLGVHGGLKALEETMGLGRPAHLHGLSGADAVTLWRLAEDGDPAALRRFCEYNLYDVINLPALMALGYNRMLLRQGAPGAPVPVAYRGDVLYDVTRILEAVAP